MQKYVMELVGAFFLTMAVTLTGNPIAIGLLLVGLMYIGAHVSGGHYNPAVSLAAYVREKIDLNEMFWYMVVQVVGALLGLWLFALITNDSYQPDVAPGIPIWVAVLVEGLLTVVYCLVWLTVLTTDRFKSTMVYGFATGLTLLGIVTIGGLFNPAIAFATMIVAMGKSGAFATGNNLFIYVISPLVGGVLAAWFVHYLNEKRK
ncbi:MAG: aquaporin [Candidatus Babeliales bacterium]